MDAGQYRKERREKQNSNAARCLKIRPSGKIVYLLLLIKYLYYTPYKSHNQAVIFYK